MEKKFHETAETLDTTKSALEEAKKQNQLLEKKLQEALQGKNSNCSCKLTSRVKLSKAHSYVQDTNTCRRQLFHDLFTASLDVDNKKCAVNAYRMSTNAFNYKYVENDRIYLIAKSGCSPKRVG